MNDQARLGLLTSPAAVRAAVASIDLHPSRTLGQNFLIDRNVRDCIVRASATKDGESVLEIGPGLGVLTDVLAERASRLIAVEKDHRLAAWLRERFRDVPRVEIRCEDALETDLHAALDGVSSVVSNLPYVTGSRILVKLMQESRRPERIAVTVQAEVAERLSALPGTGEYGLLAVWAQHDYSVKIERRISPTCFWPVPEVTSALVTMARLPRNGDAVKDDFAVRTLFYEITRKAFQHRRKRLTNALTAGGTGIENLDEALSKAGIDGKERPEVFSPDQWWNLAAVLSTVGGVTV